MPKTELKECKIQNCNRPVCAVLSESFCFQCKALKNFMTSENIVKYHHLLADYGVIATSYDMKNKQVNQHDFLLVK